MAPCPPIIAFDLAREFGWAEGAPGERPTSGSGHFASDGASIWAVFWGALCEADKRFQLARYRAVFIEAPLPPTWMRGATNIKTTMMLFGLPAVVGTVAYGRGIYTINTAKVSDVRAHFIGANPRGGEGKRLVAEKCRAKGWVEPAGRINNNRTDALALWSYACEAMSPGSTLGVKPLFAEERLTA